MRNIKILRFKKPPLLANTTNDNTGPIFNQEKWWIDDLLINGVYYIATTKWGVFVVVLYCFCEVTKILNTGTHKIKANARYGYDYLHLKV